jgi:AcrR family transcriptional regulator
MADRESRKKQITAKRRQQILEAAVGIFSQKGYSAATMPEIARAAGLASGTIYLYFPSKHELFIAVIRELVITVPLLNLVSSLSNQDFPVILKSILENRMDLIEGEKISQLSGLMSEIQRDADLRTMFSEQLIQPFLSTMENIYRDNFKGNSRFRDFDPALTVRIVGGTILGFIMLKSMEGKASPLNTMPREKVVNALTSYIFHGLMNEGSGLNREERTHE